MRKFLIIAAIFSSIFIIDQAWAQDSESIGKDFFTDPASHFFDFEGFRNNFPSVRYRHCNIRIICLVFLPSNIKT